MKKKKVDAVFVEWLDSATHPGWDKNTEENSRPLTITSVGFVVSKTKDVLIISSSKSESTRYLDQLTIPRMVVKTLRKVKI